jgi:hypothetical protein
VGRVEIENARIWNWDGLAISFEIPEEYHDSVVLMRRKLVDKHNHFCQLIFGPPFVPKTTGPFSQNNHIWGHARQIAAEVGDDPRSILREACLQTPEYPSSMGRLGKPIPQPWEDASITEASAVVETLHRQAAFLGMTLKESRLWT